MSDRSAAFAALLGIVLVFALIGGIKYHMWSECRSVHGVFYCVMKR